MVGAHWSRVLGCLSNEIITGCGIEQFGDKALPRVQRVQVDYAPYLADLASRAASQAFISWISWRCVAMIDSASLRFTGSLPNCS